MNFLNEKSKAHFYTLRIIKVELTDGITMKYIIQKQTNRTLRITDEKDMEPYLIRERYPTADWIERINERSSEIEVLNWVMDWILGKKTMVADWPNISTWPTIQRKFAKFEIGEVVGFKEGIKPSKEDTIFQIKWKNRDSLQHVDLSLLVHYSINFDTFVEPAIKSRYQTRFKYKAPSRLCSWFVNKTWAKIHPKIGQKVSALFCDYKDDRAQKFVGQVVGYLPESIIGKADEEFLIKWDKADFFDPENIFDTHTIFDSKELSNGMKFFVVDHPMVGFEVETDDANGCIQTGVIVEYIPETSVNSGDACYRIKWENERRSKIYNFNETFRRPMQGSISHRSLDSNTDDDQCTSEFRDNDRIGKRSLESIYDTVPEVKELTTPYSSGSRASSKRLKSHRSHDSNIDDDFQNHNCMLNFATPCESISTEANSGVFGGDNDVEGEGEEEVRVDTNRVGNNDGSNFQDTEVNTSESETTDESISTEANSVKGGEVQKYWGVRSIFDYILQSVTTVHLQFCSGHKN